MLESHSSEALHRSSRHDFNADQRVAYRWAVAADVDAFYGKRPSQTLRAVILTLDDTPAAIVGLADEGGYLKLFSEYKPEFKPYLRSMATLRAIKVVMGIVEKCRADVVAVTQPDEPDSPRLLQRLGFEFCNSTDLGEVFEWRS